MASISKKVISDLIEKSKSLKEEMEGVLAEIEKQRDSYRDGTLAWDRMDDYAYNVSEALDSLDKVIQSLNGE